MQQLIDFLFTDILRFSIPQDFPNILIFTLLSLVSLGTGGALQYFSFTRGRNALLRILPFLFLSVLTVITQAATIWADAHISSGDFYQQMFKVLYFVLPYLLLHVINTAAVLAWFAGGVVLLVLSIKKLCGKVFCRG